MWKQCVGHNALVLSAREMVDQLAQLRDDAVSWRRSDQESGLKIVASWNDAELILADERSRVAYWTVGRSYQQVARRMDRGGRPLATMIASMSPDGFARERALVRLVGDPSPLAGRLIAVRTSDAVDEVREQAWRAMAGRTAVDQANAIVPILVRLSGRLRAAGGLARYAAMFEQVHRRPLWGLLLEHPDRPTRRWAFSTALISDHIDAQQALRWLAATTDQWLIGRLARSVSESKDDAAKRALLTSHHGSARAIAIVAVPDEALSDATLREALLHRTARVREAASYRATRRGMDVSAIYRAAWQEDHNPRALKCAAQQGTDFALDDLRHWIRDSDPRVRAVVAELLAQADPDAGDVDLLFEMLDDEPGPASAAIRALKALDFGWPYSRGAALWATADAAKRLKLWRLLSSRGGWDRVRADLHAASGPDLQLRNQSLADLRGWWQYSSARMWRDPTPEQAAEISADLQRVTIAEPIREVITLRVNGALIR